MSRAHRASVPSSTGTTSRLVSHSPATRPPQTSADLKPATGDGRHGQDRCGDRAGMGSCSHNAHACAYKVFTSSSAFPVHTILTSLLCVNGRRPPLVPVQTFADGAAGVAPHRVVQSVTSPAGPHVQAPATSRLINTALGHGNLLCGCSLPTRSPMAASDHPLIPNHAPPLRTPTPRSLREGSALRPGWPDNQHVSGACPLLRRRDLAIMAIARSPGPTP